MHIGVLRIYFRLFSPHSLKEKRQIMKSLKDRLKNRFNVSVAEIGSNDQWQLGELGVVMIGNDHAYVNGAMDKIREFIETTPAVTPIEHQIDMM